MLEFLRSDDEAEEELAASFSRGSFVVHGGAVLLFPTLQSPGVKYVAQYSVSTSNLLHSYKTSLSIQALTLLVPKISAHQCSASPPQLVTSPAPRTVRAGCRSPHWSGVAWMLSSVGGWGTTHRPKHRGPAISAWQQPTLAAIHHRGDHLLDCCA